jgi:hypothetical protein
MQNDEAPTLDDVDGAETALVQMVREEAAPVGRLFDHDRPSG